jgi:RNA polymerase sigma-70 factor (ECF subfamily)
MRIFNAHHHDFISNTDPDSDQAGDMIMSNDIDALVTEIPSLRRYGRSLAGSRAAADDLVQDTLERAIQKFHLFEPGTRLRLWLFTIMRNIFLDHYRKNKKLPVVSIDITDFHTEQRPADQIDKLVHRDLIAELARLKPHYRELLILVGLEGLSYEQAADITGVPLGTVRSRLFRARNMLLRKLEGQDVARRRSARNHAVIRFPEISGSGPDRREAQPR